MGRAILTIIIVISIASAIAFTVTNQADPGVATLPHEQSAAAIEVAARPLPSNTFSATGTLVFYPNNVGPVPYIFYQDSPGRTAAKALTFPDGPPANFSSWTGARISVTGALDQEHVVVNRVTYLSGP